MPSGPTLTTFHEWDISGVKKGAAAIDAEYKKMLANEKMAEKVFALNEQASGRRQKQVTERMKKMAGEGNNLRMAFRDFAEGRVAYGLSRLGGNFLIIGTAAAIAYRQVRKLNDEINQTVNEMESFNVKSRQANYQSGFLSSASGSGTVAQAAVEAQSRTQEGRQAAMKGGDSLNWRDDWSKAPMAAMYGASQWLNGKVGNGTQFNPIEQAQQTTQMEARVSENAARRLAKTRSGALGRERDIAKAGGLGGSGNDQKYQENELARDREIEASKLLRMSEKDRDIINDRYNILSNTLIMERNISAARHFASSQTLTLQGSGASSFQKTFGSAGINAQRSRAALSSGNLTTEQTQQESLSLHGSWNAQRDSLADIYLTPDGHKRREHEIQSTFRKNRNNKRRRNAFNRKVDGGMFNMETGRRASPPNSGGVGLQMGGLDTGHLPFGVFGSERGRSKGGLETPQAEGFLAKIVALLQKGLPTETP